jgi:lipopolysaccharide export system protein LptA
MLKKKPLINHYYKCLAVILSLLLTGTCHAQQHNNGKATTEEVTIDNSDILTTLTLNGKQAKKLKGNVQFHQQDIIMNCDSAFLFDDNTLNAYSNVHIKQGDSMNLYGQLLDYDGNKKYAIVRKDVSLTDSKMTLTTDRLDYDVNKKEAFYTNGAVINDAANNLTSKIGYYFSATRDMYFRKDVVLTNPDYSMHCDTLQYNVINRRAIFHGPTTIISKKDTVYCETGWYNTLSGEAHFGKNAYLKSGGQVLSGDSLVYNRKKSTGRAIGGVRITDTAEKMIISGEISEHFEKVKKTFITKQALASKELDNDTLYLTADTLWSEYDPTGKYRILKGYRHARVFSRQFQAVCDSIKYSFVDSAIDMKVDPVFWFGGYQASAEHIVIHTKKNKINKADLFKNAFLVSPEDSLRYSQVKGRDMVGSFNNNELSMVDVNGNGESIYFVRDDQKAYIGANRIVSSNIRINIKERKISRINFIKDPDATLTPILKADPKELLLPGFLWRGNLRPKSAEDLKKQEIH